MIAVAIKILSALGLTEKAAKIVAPIALAGLALAGVWLIRHDGYADGRKDAVAAAERALNDALVKAHQEYLAAERENRAAYAKTLDAVTAIRGAAPQIIREIRDAPATACSSVPISDDEWLWLRRAFDRTAADDPGAG